MLELPETTSKLEAVWILGSVIGLCGTVVFLAVVARTGWIVSRHILAGRLTWSGPRWNYVLGMLIATALFLPGWVAFLVLGLLVASLPPNPYLDPDVPDIVSYIILCGMLCFACGQVGLVVSWFRVKHAVPNIFVPPAVPSL